MDITVFASAAAAVVTVVAVVLVARRPPAPSRGPSATAWLVPVALWVVFVAWTVYSIVDDGLFGFLPQHVGSPWESQITMDLLVMAGVAWFVLQPRLRAAGINPLPWVPLLLATGSVAMLPLVAMLLRAESLVVPRTDGLVRG